MRVITCGHSTLPVLSWDEHLDNLSSLHCDRLNRILSQKCNTTGRHLVKD